MPPSDVRSVTAPILPRFRGRLGRGVALLALCAHLLLCLHFAATPHEHAAHGRGWRHVVGRGADPVAGCHRDHADADAADPAPIGRTGEDGDEHPEGPRPHDDRDCALLPPALASGTTSPLPPLLATGRFVERLVAPPRRLPRTTAPLVDAPKQSPPRTRFSVS